MQTATLYFYHDPMCSWCWGYRPVSDQLAVRLPDYIRLEKVLGGLAPDSDEPMPAELQEKLPQTWRRINEMLGTEFNFDFWTECAPRRSTYPACRAVIAAGYQNAADEMTDAIQRAYYLRAMNPSDIDTLETLAGELDLGAEKFADDVRSAETEHELKRQVAFARRSPISGFPSLCLEFAGELVPVLQDYNSVEPTLAQVRELVGG